METANFIFKRYTAEELLKLTSVREGEQKIGENIVRHSFADAKYVILGVSEDLGPVANFGNRGCDKAFSSFLPKFLSVQSNAFLSGNNIGILGEVCMKKPSYEDFYKKPNVIDELDDFIQNVLSTFLSEKQILIVIGGGHNNAYPLIQYFGSRESNFGVVNCDAHADMRETSYRHSGNPFSTAFEQGFLSKYAVLGLHQSYNNQFILDKLVEHACFLTYFDDYIVNKASFDSDCEKVKSYLGVNGYGIELDMDSIAYMPSSAFSPSGISMETARKYVAFFSKSKDVKYLHLPEAAPSSPEEVTAVGKGLAYLVCDFIKNHTQI